MKAETEYLLQRASEEAKQAVSSDQPEAASAHEKLSACYSAKAVIQLMEDDEQPSSAETQPA